MLPLCILRTWPRPSPRPNSSGLAQHQRAGRVTDYEVGERTVTIRIGRREEEFSPEKAAWFIACALNPADGGDPQPFS